MKNAILLCTALLLSGGVCHAAVGPQIFADDFGTVGLFAENWKATGGLKPENGVLKMAGGRIELRRDLKDKSFAVSADFTPSALNGEYQFVAMQIDGIVFHLRKETVNTAYRPKSYTRSLGSAVKYKNYKLGDTCRFTVIRQLFGQARKYTVQINGETHLSFMDSEMEPTGKVVIYPSHANLVVDNVEINSVLTGNSSPNLAVNSSFEHLIDGQMPPYVNLATSRLMTWQLPYSEYLKTITVDTEEKHSGKNSLRLSHNRSAAETGFLMYNVGCSVGKPITGSVWLKAAKSGVKAKLKFWELHHKQHEKEVTLDNEWKRYSFTLLSPERSQIQFGASTTADCTVWADDVQVENGTEATPYLKSALDEDKFAADSGKTYEKHPDIQVTMVKKAPVIDGDLSDFPKTSKANDFLIKSGKKPDSKTAVYFACDGKYLYVAVQCFVADISRIKQQTFARDLGHVYAPESVELFFDPALSGKNYYQLAVNAGNSQADCGPGRNPAWNGTWKSAVKLNKAARSVDYEIAIPLSDFADMDINDIWGFNAGRNDVLSNQCSSLLRSRMDNNYHQPQLFPRLIFPAGTLDEVRRISAERAAAAKAKLNSANALELYSRYSFALSGGNAEIVGKSALPQGKYSGKITFRGKTFDFNVTPDFQIKLSLADVPAGEYPATAEIFADGKKVASASSNIKVLANLNHPYTVIDRLNRALVIDGKPALMVAPFLGIERKYTAEMSRMKVRTLAEAGFKYVTAGSHEPDNPATQAFIEEANKYGMKVVYWCFYTWRMRDQWNYKEVADKVRKYPNVAAFLVVDEPELYAKSDDVKAFMQKYQRVLPELPVFMNNTVIGIPARFAGFSTDILMIDDYVTNREGRTVREMLDAAEAVEKAGRSERKPAWFFPSGDNLHNHYRECSFDEQIAQCYAMLVRGCTGLVHFCGIPKYPRNWDALKQINKEFLDLQDAVFSAEACPEAASAEKSLALITRKLGSKVYIIAVNPDNKTVKTTFRLPEGFKYDGKAEVRFENRSVSVKNGIFSDTFQPYERHVYTVEIK